MKRIRNQFTVKKITNENFYIIVSGFKNWFPHVKFNIPYILILSPPAQKLSKNRSFNKHSVRGVLKLCQPSFWSIQHSQWSTVHIFTIWPVHEIYKTDCTSALPYNIFKRWGRFPHGNNTTNEWVYLRTWWSLLSLLEKIKPCWPKFVPFEWPLYDSAFCPTRVGVSAVGS